MTRFTLFVFASLSLVPTAFAEIKNTGGDDVLTTVSQKLTQIDERLKDHRVFVSPAVFNWKEWENFRTELLYAVAHDPNGPVSKDIPTELSPAFLTQKLKVSWSALELSVLEIAELEKDTEWEALKTDMSQFFKLREDFLYQPARSMIKSGLIVGRLQKIKEAATRALQDSKENKNVSVKVVDPYVEKMAYELALLNRSVRELDAFRNPPPVEIPTIYKPVLYQELFVFGSGFFFTGILLACSMMWIKKKLTKIPVEEKPAVNKSAFNYYEWLKRLETNLQAIKNNEENTSEQYITLKGFAHQLSEARKNLNLADSQQDYYTSLEHLNVAAPKIEEHFEKANLKKHAEATRRLISQIVQLCDAIENKKEMSFEDEKPKLRVIKLEQVSNVKVA